MTRPKPLDVRPAQAHDPVVAVVALGANLGDRAATLADAAVELARIPLVDEVRMSQPIESVAVKPHGPDAEAPPYLNAVALLTTRLAPSLLLGYLHAIESAHGRVREVRWGDRTLDLDIVAYGDVRSDDPDLTLPHPRAAERDFVLRPWLTVDPDAVLPGRGRVADLLAALDGSPGVKRTGIGILLTAAVLGVGAGFLLDQVLTSLGRATFTPTVSLPLLLLLLGAIVVLLALPIRRATRGPGGKPVNPFRAMRVAILAKASSIVGAAVGGIGLGLLLFLVTRPVTPSLGSMGAIIVTAVAGAVLVAAGLVAEHLCTLRKDDDDQQPGVDDTGLSTHH